MPHSSVQDLASVASATRYPLAAFLFIQRGLDFTVRREHGDLDEEATPEQAMHKSRHISGAMLCYGLRDYALQEYGMLARTVLKRWNIHSCEDFGAIVFTMVEAGLMAKTDEDSIGDFFGVFSFGEAFGAAISLGER